MEFFEKVKELQMKGKDAEEIAFILGTDSGRVRLVMNGEADPENDRDEYELVDNGDEEDEEDDDEDDEEELFSDEDDDFEEENEV